MTSEVLGEALKNGSLSMATLDEHVRRILRLAVRCGLVGSEKSEPTGPLYNTAGKQVAYDVAAESIVLLKNENNLLPLDLKKIRRIAVIGPNAYPSVFGGGGSSSVTPFAASDLYTSLSDAIAPKVEVFYSPGILREADMFAQTNFDAGLTQEIYSNQDFRGESQKSIVQHVNAWQPSAKIGGGGDGAAKSYRWTGTYTVPTSGDYVITVGAHGGDSYTLCFDKAAVLEHERSEGTSPQSTVLHLAAGQHVSVELDYVQRGRELPAGLGITPMSAMVLPEVKAMAAGADAVIVSLGFNPSYESEAFDRSWQLLPGQDQLVEASLAANPHTIVVLNAGGGTGISKWVDRVPAVLDAWYGGEEGAHALADVLGGKINPSGKLPISFERNLEDNAAFPSYYPRKGTNDVPYSEGLFIGYRHFDRSTTKPLFPFGFGLTYTQFTFSNLVAREEKPGVVNVSFTMTNTGTRSGEDVAQIYVGEHDPPLPRPMKELKGFQRIRLEPGEKQQVEIRLDPRAFSYWDINSHAWKQDAATFEIYAGDSSVSVPLKTSIFLK